MAAARAELEAKGVEFVGETIETGVCHMAFFKDPDGNSLMLHRRYAHVVTATELLERYRALPLPTTKDEHWRFTDLEGFDPDAWTANGARGDRRAAVAARRSTSPGSRTSARPASRSSARRTGSASRR